MRNWLPRVCICWNKPYRETQLVAVRTNTADIEFAIHILSQFKKENGKKEKSLKGITNLIIYFK